MQAEKSKSDREYIKRIHFVLDFIEKNLDEDLSLKQLSQKAHYSPYHFHRVFLTITGENTNQYVNRKRIERIASTLLINPDSSIKELAYNYGFNSESSFSRAFKSYYGISPTKFKSEGKTILSKIGIVPFATEKYICGIDDIKHWTEMNAQITIRELQDIKLASIMHIGEFYKIGSIYQDLMDWANKKELLPASGFKAITIYHDNPNVTHTSKVRYSVCVTIQKDIKAEGRIRPFQIKKGTYAVGRFTIDANDFVKAWKSMTIWVIENDYKFRDGDYFETYLNDHKTHPAQKFMVDLCIPVENSHRIKTPSDRNDVIENAQSEAQLDYYQLISHMKAVRTFFLKEYSTDFSFGTIYQGSRDFSYFSLTPIALKKQKLKFVIILNHKLICFKICLSGQNKSIRKKYWKLFKGSDWNTYHIAESIDDSLSIIDHMIAESPNFYDMTTLIKQIEIESFKFINEIRSILEED